MTSCSAASTAQPQGAEPGKLLGQQRSPGHVAHQGILWRGRRNREDGVGQDRIIEGRHLGNPVPQRQHVELGCPDRRIGGQSVLDIHIHRLGSAQPGVGAAAGTVKAEAGHPPRRNDAGTTPACGSTRSLGRVHIGAQPNPPQPSQQASSQEGGHRRLIGSLVLLGRLAAWRASSARPACCRIPLSPPKRSARGMSDYGKTTGKAGPAGAAGFPLNPARVRWGWSNEPGRLRR